MLQRVKRVAMLCRMASLGFQPGRLTGRNSLALIYKASLIELPPDCLRAFRTLAVLLLLSQAVAQCMLVAFLAVDEADRIHAEFSRPAMGRWLAAAAQG